MLSAAGWVPLMKLCEEADPKMLAVVPSPDLDELEKSGATSVDLRLGRWFRTFRQSRTSSLDLSGRAGEPTAAGKRNRSYSELTTETFVPFGEAFLLHPHSFVLGITLHWLRLPSDLSGYITGKSSLGRRGLVIETAAGIHPGFSGCLALELSNVGEIPLELFPGMPVCQIFLHQVIPVSESAHTQFLGRRKPILGYLKEDAVMRQLRGPPIEKNSSNP